jgi:hypothetical protein
MMEAGRIIERGTHESLYTASGRYYDLYTTQHDASREESSDGGRKSLALSSSAVRLNCAP